MARSRTNWLAIRLFHRSIGRPGPTQTQLHRRLLELTRRAKQIYAPSGKASVLQADESPSTSGRGFDSVPEQNLVIITCRDEQQVELLKRFTAAG